MVEKEGISMGWLSGWSKRRSITVDHTVLTEALVRFPLLLYLSTSSGKGSKDLTSIFTELPINGARRKIAVTTSDGTTQLYVEIEKWDSSGKKAFLWVSKAGWIISNTEDTILYIYYDITKPDNTSYVGDKGSTPALNVWDTFFKMVQHMTGVGSPIIDSTNEANDGVEGSHTPTYGAIGKVGDGITFNGTSDRFRVTKLDAEQPLSFTIEAWVKVSSGHGGAIFPHSTILNNEYYFDWNLAVLGHKAHTEANINSITPYKLDGATSIDDDTWHRIVAVYRGINGLFIYVDGNEDGTIAHVGGQVINFYNSAHIGVGQYSASLYEWWFNGTLDEVRYSGLARTANHIKTDFYNQTDALVTYGNQEGMGTTIQVFDTIMLAETLHVQTPQGSTPTVVTHDATDVGVY